MLSDRAVTWIVFAAVLYLVLFVGGVGLIAVVSGAGGDPDDPVLVARGGVLYGEHCAACHGTNLEGQPDWETQNADGTFPAPPADGTGHAWEHSDRQLFEVVKFGGVRFSRPGVKSAMPSFEDELESADIWAILAFIKSRWPEEVRKEQQTRGLFSGPHLH
ncbi:MAG: cytochrome c [Rhodospirillales bacterium]|nr:cytochrome c [Rhodospirillales bacterium]